MTSSFRPLLALGLLSMAMACAERPVTVNRAELDPLLEAQDKAAVEDLLESGMNPVFGLVRAARVGSVPMVEYFLARGADPNGALADGFNSTALMAGASGNHPEVISVLVAAGADPDQPDAMGDPALNWAAYMGQVEYAEGLLAVGARSDIRTSHGNAFEIALRQGWEPLIALFGGEATEGLAAAEAALVDLLMVTGTTDFEAAEAVKRALAVGVSPDLNTAAGIPLLAVAAERGQVKTVRSLLEAGAHVDATDPIEFTALTYGARGGSIGVVRELLGAGAAIDHRGGVEGMGMTPLHMAAAKGQTAAAATLLALGANVDTLNARGESALTWSITEGHPETALALLEAGADPDLAGEMKYSARQAAEDYGFTEVLDAMNGER